MQTSIFPSSISNTSLQTTPDSKVPPSQLKQVIARRLQGKQLNVLPFLPLLTGHLQKTIPLQQYMALKTLLLRDTWQRMQTAAISTHDATDFVATLLWLIDRRGGDGAWDAGQHHTSSDAAFDVLCRIFTQPSSHFPTFLAALRNILTDLDLSDDHLYQRPPPDPMDIISHAAQRAMMIMGQEEDDMRTKFIKIEAKERALLKKGEAESQLWLRAGKHVEIGFLTSELSARKGIMNEQIEAFNEFLDQFWADIKFWQCLGLYFENDEPSNAVKVIGVDDDTPAKTADLRLGDIIAEGSVWHQAPNQTIEQKFAKTTMDVVTLRDMLLTQTVEIEPGSNYIELKGQRDGNLPCSWKLLVPLKAEILKPFNMVTIDEEMNVEFTPPEVILDFSRIFTAMPQLRPWMGFSALRVQKQTKFGRSMKDGKDGPANASLNQSLIQPPTTVTSIVLRNVVEDGPAYAAGIRDDDELVALNGQVINSLPTFASTFRKHAIMGKPVTVTYKRQAIVTENGRSVPKMVYGSAEVVVGSKKREILQGIPHLYTTDDIHKILADPSKLAEVCQVAFTMADANMDGLLSPSEFAEAMRKWMRANVAGCSHRSYIPEDELRDEFEKADADCSGLLTPTELQPVIERLLRKSAVHMSEGLPWIGCVISKASSRARTPGGAPSPPTSRPSTAAGGTGSRPSTSASISRSGTFMKDVARGGPADRAGLKDGDEIISFGGYRTPNLFAWMEAFRSKAKVGATVAIEYRRRGMAAGGSGAMPPGSPTGSREGSRSQTPAIQTTHVVIEARKREPIGELPSLSSPEAVEAVLRDDELSHRVSRAAFAAADTNLGGLITHAEFTSAVRFWLAPQLQFGQTAAYDSDIASAYLSDDLITKKFMEADVNRSGFLTEEELEPVVFELLRLLVEKYREAFKDANSKFGGDAHSRQMHRHIILDYSQLTPVSSAFRDLTFHPPVPWPPLTTYRTTSGLLIEPRSLYLDHFMERPETRAAAIALLRALDLSGINTAFLLKKDNWHLYLPYRFSGRAKVFRDFVQCPPPPPLKAMVGPTPMLMHIKTNIPSKSNIMYRFQLEGFNYGTNTIINCDIVGYAHDRWDKLGAMETFGWPMGWDSATVAFYSKEAGIELTQYYTSDEFVALKLYAPSYFCFGLTVSGWLVCHNYGADFLLSGKVFFQPHDL